MRHSFLLKDCFSAAVRTLAVCGLFLIPGLIFSLPVLEAAETVQINSRNGAPCIEVDGKPVRARVFYGGPASRPVVLGTEKKVFELEFTPMLDSKGHGTLHFRFGKEPGKIRIDDLSITEKETGRVLIPENRFETDEDVKKWHTWHTTLQGREIASVKRKDGAMEVEIFPIWKRENLPADFHIYCAANLNLEASKRYCVRFSMESDQKRFIKAAFYRPGNPFVYLGGANSGYADLFAAQIRMAADAGANFVSFAVPNIWPNEKGEYNFKEIDETVERVLKVNPDALLLPRIGMNAPEWFLRKYPDAQMVWHGVEKVHWGMVTPSSLEYRAAGKAALEALVTHLEQKYGRNMAGYHPCGQNTGEWFTYDAWLAGMAGYAPEDLKAWRIWLKEKYGTDTALRQAWKLENVTLDSAEVPSFEMYKESHREPILKNPILLDFNAFRQDQMCETVLAFSESIRKASAGKKLVLLFYGYTFEFGALPNSPAYSAHYALQKVLASPYVDVICSPQSYFDRGAGGGGQCMLPSESVALAGKMYLLEDDTRTFLTPDSADFPGFFDGGKTREETRELLRRNTAQCACRNYSTWWMDLGSAGWYADEGLWEEMKGLEEMDRYFIENPTPYLPDTAVFVDEEAMLRISHGMFSRKSIYEQRAPLARMGASYAQHFTSDLWNGRLAKKPKMCVMLHEEFYSPEEKAKIREAVGEEALLWVGMEGISAEELRKEAKKRGVHLFTDCECNVWANGPYVVLHAAEDGPVTVTFKNGKRENLTLKKGETRVLREQP